MSENQNRPRFNLRKRKINSNSNTSELYVIIYIFVELDKLMSYDKQIELNADRVAQLFMTKENKTIKPEFSGLLLDSSC